MSYEIVMPRLGWNMEEGTLVEWLKQDGETVHQGETVCTIEGDKAATDIESFDSGILKIPDASPPPGKTVPVGTLLGYIVAEHEIEAFDPNKVQSLNMHGATSAGVSSPEPAIRVEHERAASAATGRESGVPAISPRARRAARSAGIDWRRLKGTGRSGRIVERDVLEAARFLQRIRQLDEKPEIGFGESKEL